MSKRATTKPDADLAKWCEALAANGQLDEVPPGWMTTAQIAAMLNKGHGTTGAQLSRAVREGRAEVKRFRIQTPRGAYPVPHYRLK